MSKIVGALKERETIAWKYYQAIQPLVLSHCSKLVPAHLLTVTHVLIM